MEKKEKRNSRQSFFQFRSFGFPCNETFVCLQPTIAHILLHIFAAMLASLLPRSLRREVACCSRGSSPYQWAGLCYIMTSHCYRNQKALLGGLFPFNGWCGLISRPCILSLPLRSSSTPSYFMTMEARKIRFYMNWDL